MCAPAGWDRERPAPQASSLNPQRAQRPKILEVWPFKGIPAAPRTRSRALLSSLHGHEHGSSLAGMGCSGQQAPNQRSARAGRAHGVGAGGGMRAHEGVDAIRERGTCTCARARPKRHPAPDALACLRPTMGGGSLGWAGGALCVARRSVRKVRFVAACKFRDRAHRVSGSAPFTKTPEFEFAGFLFTEISTPPRCNRHLDPFYGLLLRLSGAAFRNTENEFRAEPVQRVFRWFPPPCPSPFPVRRGRVPAPRAAPTWGIDPPNT